MKKHLFVSFFLSILNAQQVQLPLTRAKLQELAENSLGEENVGTKVVYMAFKNSRLGPFNKKDRVAQFFTKSGILDVIKVDNQYYFTADFGKNCALVVTSKRLIPSQFGHIVRTQTMGYIGDELVIIRLKRFEHCGQNTSNKMKPSCSIKCAVALIGVISGLTTLSTWYYFQNQ